MSCCGQKRRALRDPGRLPRTAPEPAAPVLRNPQRLRHLQSYSLLVKGPVTGQAYLFGGRDTLLAVDERDAAPMIASGRFGAAAGG